METDDDFKDALEEPFDAMRAALNSPSTSNTNDLLKLLKNEDTKKLANLLIKLRKFRALKTIISKESEDCQMKFAQCFQDQPDYLEEVSHTRSTDTAVEDKTTIDDILDYISTDERRKLLCFLIIKKQWATIEKILKTENEKARRMFKLWKNDACFKGDSSNNEPVDELADCEEENSDLEAENIPPDFFKNFPKETNILILGETGVGKSTFVNALSNYLKFENVMQAKTNCEIMITAHFCHQDDDYNSIEIKCLPTINLTEEEQENEDAKAGRSATQKPRSYRFTVGNNKDRKTVTLIDTPGVGDVRGSKQEVDNFHSIMKRISQYQEIHAILILLKANQTKLTTTFKYCLNELLTKLHVSARKNVIFCITRARDSKYQPGSTFEHLKTYLKELNASQNRIDIPLNRSNVFCFDNESFRFLCAYREGIKFKEDEVVMFNDSWKISVKETFRLFGIISQLPRHKVAETLNIYNIRSILLSFAKPLADMAKTYMMNAQLLENHYQAALACDTHDTEIPAFIEQIEQYVKTFDKPRTVCTSMKCSEYANITSQENFANVPVRRRLCHDPCELPKVEGRDSTLKDCYLFHLPDGLCRVCKCPWEDHVHSMYENLWRTIQVPNPNADQQQKTLEEKREKHKRIIEEKREMKYKLKKESDQIKEYTADFAYFLKKHGMMQFNTEHKQYVNQMIKEAGAKNEMKMVAELMKHRDKYEEQIKLMEGHGPVRERPVKTIEEIYQMIEDLKEKHPNVFAKIEEIELINAGQYKEKTYDIRENNGWFWSRFK